MRAFLPPHRYHKKAKNGFQTWKPLATLQHLFFTCLSFLDHRRKRLLPAIDRERDLVPPRTVADLPLLVLVFVPTLERCAQLGHGAAVHRHLILS